MEPETNMEPETKVEDTPKRGPGRPPKPAHFPVKIIKKYMPMNGDGPCLPGSEVDLPVDEARHIIGLGIAERNDPIG